MTEEALKNIFSDNLKYWMSLKGKRQADLVIELGFHHSTVSDWITAKKMPRPIVIQQLADYFGIPISALLEKQDNIEQWNIFNEWEKKEILELFNQLHPEERTIVLGFTRTLYQRSKDGEPLDDLIAASKGEL